MRIRKRWPTTSTSTPDLPSNGLLHQHQFQQEPNSIVATTAARAGLHPNRFLAIWPQNHTHPIRFQQQNDGRDHQPLLNPHPNNDMGPSKNDQMPRNQVLQVEKEKESKDPEAKGIMDNTTVANERKKTSSGAASQQETSSWPEEEKAFPFKKRKGIYDRRETGKKEMGEKENSMNSRERKKTSKKYEYGGGYDDEEDQATSSSRVRRKGRNAGGTLLEGSRCSRVNGRGWRCSQKTLVGYSLCEHHLGKGRIKNVGTIGKNSRQRSSAIIRSIDGCSNDDDEENDATGSEPLLHRWR